MAESAQQQQQQQQQQPSPAQQLVSALQGIRRVQHMLELNYPQLGNAIRVQRAAGDLVWAEIQRRQQQQRGTQGPYERPDSGNRAAGAMAESEQQQQQQLSPEQQLARAVKGVREVENWMELNFPQQGQAIQVLREAGDLLTGELQRGQQP
jgi:hypothetical protein